MAAIERAAAARKFIFVFFWKEKNQQTDQAWSVLQPAAAKMTDWAEVAAVQVTDPAEQELVARYDLTRTPLPLVLAIAPCGAITKAFHGKFTEEQLRAAYVSPCTQLCLKALQDKKLVLLCVVDQAGPNAAEVVPPGVRDFKADETYGGATEIVFINASDEGEATFLKELQVNPKAAQTLFGPVGTAGIRDWAVRRSREQGANRRETRGCPEQSVCRRQVRPERMWAQEVTVQDRR